MGLFLQITDDDPCSSSIMLTEKAFLQNAVLFSCFYKDYSNSKKYVVVVLLSVLFAKNQYSAKQHIEV